MKVVRMKVCTHPRKLLLKNIFGYFKKLKSDKENVYDLSLIRIGAQEKLTDLALK
jgi:hypothetical protein